MECDMDACTAKPTFSWDHEGITAKPALDLAPATEDARHPPDGSEKHCRPLVSGQVQGVQLRVRRHIHEWNDYDFEIFKVAVNQMRNGVGFYWEDEGDYPTTWGSFVMVHGYGHGNPSPGGPFLLWHRRFIYDLETQLQVVTKNCSVTLPYWNSNMEARNPLGSSVFSPTRFGGRGHSPGTSRGGRRCNSNGRNRRQGYCLTNGLAAGWTLTSGALDIDDCSHCVHRLPTANSLPSSAAVLREIQSTSDFGRVNEILSATHNLVHANVCGGTMGIIDTSPRDPMFFLHHAYVDRLFDHWLHYHKARGVEVTLGQLPSQIMNYYRVPGLLWMGTYSVEGRCSLLPRNNPKVCIHYKREDLR